MPGSDSRRGFRFQDLYLLKRLLEDLARRKRAELDDQEAPSPVIFGLEARTKDEEGRPEWDLVSLQVGANHEVSEVKSGEVDADDRRAFWKRLRRELTGQGATVTPVLVVNADNPPDQIEYWTQLHDGRATEWISSMVPPAERVRRVDSTEDLVAEALFYLTNPPVRDGDSPAIAATAAREALGRFRLVKEAASELEESIRQVLNVLAPTPDPEPVCRMLEGWLSDRATSPDQTLRRFSGDELLSQIGLLRRLMECSQTAVRLATLIRRAVHPAVLAQWEYAFGKGLTEVSLNDAQPDLADVDWDRLKRPAAIVGDAGQGKTRALTQIYSLTTRHPGAQLVFVANAEDLGEYVGGGDEAEGAPLTQALLLLADYAALEGQRLLLLVDGLDQVSAVRRTGIARILNLVCMNSAFRAVVTCRRPDWDEQARLQAALGTWHRVLMRDWPDELIGASLRTAGITRPLSGGVRELLRHPLYLDILVRTFGDNSAIPENLQTRHGLFSHFWRSRVLGDAAAVRLRVLREACDHMSVGRKWVPDFPGESLETIAVGELISTGLFVRTDARGTVAFRHPLLRDFAMGQWTLTGGTPAETRAALGQCESPVIRFGAHRAVLEAAIEGASSPYAAPFSLHEYLEANPEPEVADILGGFVPSAAVDPATWESAPPPSIVARLIRALRFAQNCGWGPIFAAWPDNPGWPDRQPWFTIEVFQELINYTELISPATDDERPDDCLVALITRLRQWSGASKLVPNLDFFRQRLVPLLARWVPTAETVLWLGKYEVESSPGYRFALLKGLPVLAKWGDGSQAVQIAQLFRHAAGLTSPSEKRESVPGLDDYDIVDWCLIGTVRENEGVPLLDAFPREFVHVALEVITVMSRKDYVRRISTGNHLPPLVNDEPELRYWDKELSMQQADARLIDGLHERLGRWLHEDPVWFQTEIYPTIRQSLLATVQTVRLQLLAESDDTRHLGSEARETLLDSRLYRIDEGLFWLDKLLRREWETLSSPQQQEVRKILRDLAREGEWELLVAVNLLEGLPGEAVPSVMAKIRDQLSSEGHYRVIRDPRDSRMIHDDRWGEVRPDIGQWTVPVDPTDMERFLQTCKELDADSTNLPDPDIAGAAETAAAKVVPALLGAIPQLVQTPWPLRSLRQVLYARQRLERRNAGLQKDGRLTADIARLALDVMEQAPVTPTPSPPDPHGGFVADAWYYALDLAHTALCQPELRERFDLSDPFLLQLERGYYSGSEVAQGAILRIVHPWHWQRPDRPRLEKLRVWVLERTVGLRALRSAIALVSQLGEGAHTMPDEVFESILSREMHGEVGEMALQLGQAIGSRALAGLPSGRRLQTSLFMDKLLEDLGRYELLKEPWVRIELLWGMVFGLKEQAKSQIDTTWLAADYARWLTQLWDLIGPLRPSRRSSRPSELMLFALHWMSDASKAKSAPVRQWWVSLLPLVRRAVTEGPRREVGAIFSLSKSLAQSVITPTEVFALVEALMARAGDECQNDPGNPLHRDRYQWTEILEYAVSTVGSVCHTIAVDQRELDKGYRLLERFSQEPFGLTDAHRQLVSLRARIERA